MYNIQEVKNKKMQLEVDQSGKIELLSQDTIIACSNDRQYSIKIPKKIKQYIHYNYKSKIKQLNYKLFSIGVYCCIENFLKNSQLIIIDDEYHGKNNLVKSILISYIKRKYKSFDEKLIKIALITRNSNAHHVAIETFRGEHKPNEVLTEKQIWRLLK